ncbi:MAG: DNA endonuclease SmrA [Halieaceae bacterium]|jgi:DNA-nicking Smr family endonuclease|nr:DNA endonuclease SmrA [Halieaceae bacterium]
MNDDENFLFEQEMAGVKPLKHTPRVKLSRQQVSDANALARREAAAAERGPVNPLSEEGIEPLDPWYVLEFKRPGVQNGVYRKLKQGRYEPEARLNLHRMTVKQARQEIHEFIEEASELGLRTVIVVHGKGENSNEAGRRQASVIKGCVNQWLFELEAVQAFHSAQPRHGGTGAAYVLLKKGEDAKQKNRERFRGEPKY